MMDPKKKPVSLSSLFIGFPLAYSPWEIPDVPISGIEIDSRKVKPGDLFIARKGGSVDGHDFIHKAIEQGANAVAGEHEIRGLDVPYIRVEDSIQAVTWLAAAFNDWPGMKLTVIGVTGTDGKTTTCNLIHQVLMTAGIKAGLISTVNAVIGDEELDTGFHVTTPDAPDVQYYLAKMVEAGLTHVVLETTSHGLAQHRVDASQYDLAVFTNITHEHLDQHGTYENYLEAKGRLIELLNITRKKPQGNPRLAVINHDDSSHEYLSKLAEKYPSVTACNYGVSSQADLRAENVHLTSQGIRFDAKGRNIDITITSPLVGAFNVTNILAAIATAMIGLGIDGEKVAKGISTMAGIPGRMERIDLGQRFTAVVDFAHTPNALRVALTAARTELKDIEEKPSGRRKGGRLIAVFGSAGLRDKEKRRMMAETAIELADVSIFTAEDPRTESLEGILNEMKAGALSKGGVEGKTFHCIPDRGEAIRFACQAANPGDTVMVCGKGHEQSMCFGEVEYPWDDRTALRASLAEALGIPGSQMPHLPTQDTTYG
jgi:UDP-N-acetylmuramoyl-L-alanyl-D-glutamate--2,6-diaminopimelate ligase